MVTYTGVKHSEEIFTLNLMSLRSQLGFACKIISFAVSKRFLSSIWYLRCGIDDIVYNITRLTNFNLSSYVQLGGWPLTYILYRLRSRWKNPPKNNRFFHLCEDYRVSFCIICFDKDILRWFISQFNKIKTCICTCQARSSIRGWGGGNFIIDIYSIKDIKHRYL